MSERGQEFTEFAKWLARTRPPSSSSTTTTFVNILDARRCALNRACENESLLTCEPWPRCMTTTTNLQKIQEVELTNLHSAMISLTLSLFSFFFFFSPFFSFLFSFFFSSSRFFFPSLQFLSFLRA